MTIFASLCIHVYTRMLFANKDREKYITDMTDRQRTLKESVTFTGTGLHTGLNVTMTVHPAEENHGIKFKRVDLEGQPIIDAIAENVVDTSRGTTIANKDAKISTIEHLLAAIIGCDMDNALVEIDAPEVPIMDGSALEYVRRFNEIGSVEQAADREYYEITEKTSFIIEESGVEIVAYPDEEFSANVNIDFKSNVIGKQYATLNSLAEVAGEIAPCRTFVFLHEIMPLIQGGLIKGGDLDNAIVIVEKSIPEDEMETLRTLFDKKDLEVCSAGYLNNNSLRFENEIARHKLLDVVGDLALIGMRIKGKIFATRPGHYANTQFAKLVRKNIKRDAAKPRYKYDVNQTPVYDINQIKNLLPHRYPFLLVDKVIHLDESVVVGIKNVTANEEFFNGHFPAEPVMPGVLQVEAMAQCGGILALSTVPDPENYSTYFLKIDGVRFKRKVVPGDTLMFVLELAEPIRRGIVVMNAQVFVGDQLVSEALLMAQIAKNKK